MEVHCTRAEEGRKLKVECKSGRKNIRQRRDAEVGGECAGKFAVRERENDSRSEKERNKARKQESEKARKHESKKARKQESKKGQPGLAVPRKLALTSLYFLAAVDLAAASAYFLVKRSTRPAVSTSFCLQVKKGWQFEQISTRSMSPLMVERVWKVLPQAQWTVTG